MKILAIETSTAVLSVALGVWDEGSGALVCDGKVFFRSTESEGFAAGAASTAGTAGTAGAGAGAGTVAGGPNKHAALCAVFIDEVLREAGLKAGELDAVALSSGPGSYTGLRVGCSSAKGLCFGAGVPLIAVPTTEILAKMVCRGGRGDVPSGPIIPMIDARRMEVYTATYKATSHSFEQVEPIHAQVVDAETFAGVTDAVFVGDGAAKCEEFLKGHGVIVDCHPSARALLDIACGKFIGAKSQEYEQNFVEQGQAGAKQGQAGVEQGQSGAEQVQAGVEQGRTGAEQVQAGVEQGQTGADSIFVDVAYFEPFYLKDFVATESKKKLW